MVSKDEPQYAFLVHCIWIFNKISSVENIFKILKKIYLINTFTKYSISFHVGSLIAIVNPFHGLFYRIKPDVKL